ncbi:MAG: hypothetical protein E3J54_03515 [Actinobacteria bacterium]|nr:MAG: hypothetical protein E3J54_03515 [Actinomycetota bacterium]
MFKILLALVAIATYIAGVIILRKYRVWLTYYLFAVFGLVLIMVLGLQETGLDKIFEFFELNIVGKMASIFNISVVSLGANNIRVFDSAGPVVLTMGIESSGLIEFSILIGLISFYPAFKWQKKLLYLGIGLSSVIIANLIRILIIVFMTRFMGRETIFLSHAIVGRLFFFACMIILFWYIITRPTIEEVSKIVRGEYVG